MFLHCFAYAQLLQGLSFFISGRIKLKKTINEINRTTTIKIIISVSVITSPYINKIRLPIPNTRQPRIHASPV